MKRTGIILMVCALAFISAALHAATPLKSIASRYGLTVSGSTYSARYKISGRGITAYIGPGLGQMVVNGSSHSLLEQTSGV